MELFLAESEVHDLIIGEKIIQDGLKSILDINDEIKLIHEDEYINGIIADFTLVHNEKIRSIIEVKGGKIGITDYIRRIGQIFQYEYFCEKDVIHKSIPYDKDFNTIYMFPSTVLRNNTFNVAKFKYPNSTMIIELNEVNNAVRHLSRKELAVLDMATDDNLVTISQYYFRDNRIFEYYILLKYLLLLNSMGHTSCKRTEVEDRFLKKIGTINNGNWRNAFITVSLLGLINRDNMPTSAGKALAILEYEDFAVKIYYSYLSIYADEFFGCFGGKNTLIANNPQISEIIKAKYKNRDVLFLTQSKNRYISSWLNILRDDYGIISFEPSSSKRILNYIPSDLQSNAFALQIKKYSLAYPYIEKYFKLIQNGEY